MPVRRVHRQRSDAGEDKRVGCLGTLFSEPRSPKRSLAPHLSVVKRASNDLVERASKWPLSDWTYAVQLDPLSGPLNE